MPVCTAHPGQGASGIVPSRGRRIGKRGFRVQVRVGTRPSKFISRQKTGGERRRMPRRRGGAGIGNHSISESNPSESDSPADDSEHRLQKTPSQNMLRVTASGSREYHAPSLTGSMRLLSIQATGRVRVRVLLVVAEVLRGNLSLRSRA